MVEVDNVVVFVVVVSFGYEDVLQVEGVVCVCYVVNDKFCIGNVEVIVMVIIIFNKVELLLFYVYENLGEEICLKYCYLDLCCLEMQCMQCICIKLVQVLCCYLDVIGFQDIEILILIKVILEGVCDFLVLVCMYLGEFYVLLQSLQLFKQILMVVGFDCYYQIVCCFCDEVLCVDCQLEFIQLDMEFVFVCECDVQDFVEIMICVIFKEVVDVELDVSFLCMIWVEVMCWYGLDKLDLCIVLELVDVVELVKISEFLVFIVVVNDVDGCVVVLCILGGVSLLCKQIDEYVVYVVKYGVKGLVYIKIVENGEVSLLIVKFFSEEVFVVLVVYVGVGNGDIVFFGVGGYNKVFDFMGVLCLKVGKDFDLVVVGWVLLWVIDFLMFEYDDEVQCYVVLYYFFIVLVVDDIVDLCVNVKMVVLCGYDMVFNGNEIGGGLICIYCLDMQSVVFELFGIGVEEVEGKFGFLFDVLCFGVLLYGGIVFGIDCIVVFMVGIELICDVILFFKIIGVQCLMIGVLLLILDEQLVEVYVQVCLVKQ